MFYENEYHYYFQKSNKKLFSLSNFLNFSTLLNCNTKFASLGINDTMLLLLTLLCTHHRDVYYKNKSNEGIVILRTFLSIVIDSHSQKYTKNLYLIDYLLIEMTFYGI